MKKILIICAMLFSSYALSQVNINTANDKELKTLPGIGEKKAASIIKYRDEHGKFKDINELTNVSGINKKMVENFGDKVVLDSNMKNMSKDMKSMDKNMDKNMKKMDKNMKEVKKDNM